MNDAKLGELTNLKREIRTITVEIDGLVKNIVVHFDPIDEDMTYVKRIDPERLQVYIDGIARKKKVLDRKRKRAAELAEELEESVD